MRLSPAWLARAEEWLQPSVVLTISAVSLILVVLNLLALPWLVRLIPADYLLRSARSEPEQGMALLLRLLKNAAGVVLLVLGVLMLALPGQGILTIVIALGLLDFPGKRRLERRLLRNPRISGIINRWRVRGGKQELLTPPDSRPSSRSAPRPS
jgi:hypothetical protein